MLEGCFCCLACYWMLRALINDGTIYIWRVLLEFFNNCCIICGRQGLHGLDDSRLLKLHCVQIVLALFDK